MTDLHYEARGRDYGEEDLYLTRRLGAELDLALCDPRAAHAFLDGVDGVVFRNAGPVTRYADEYGAFRQAALATRIPVYNPLSGRGDMRGKRYLIELSRAGWPVIPTVGRRAELPRLGEAEAYVVKPLDGADSIGLRVVDRSELDRTELTGMLVQPRVEFDYEVSFYFVDAECHYALYAPDRERRWELEPYDPSEADLAFARRFIGWNGIEHGIQRVDGCRTREGRLLLMELEDLNPYLSLSLLAKRTRERFIDAFRTSLRRLLAKGAAPAR